MSYRFIGMGLAIALNAVCSWIQIPFVPVPLTLQTCAVYVTSALLGGKRAFWSQVGYLALGLAGLPLFSRGGGLGYVFQPTFGYLAAFPLAAWIIGSGIEKKGSDAWGWSLLWPIAQGMAVIYAVGLLGLYLNLQLVVGHPVSLGHLLMSGCLLFLPGESVKMAMAVFLIRRLRKQLSYERWR